MRITFLNRLFRKRPLSLRRKVVYALIAALPILAIFTFGNRGLLKRMQLERQAATVREQLYRDRATSDSLRAEITRMKNDTTVIERLARERYGMVRPGETIYHVDEQ
ncbi:MAG: septum formation initiator family protein [Bacteroidetes bacterium]|nr:septum formation initiator family protein [Bacteroidota bacterium]